MNFARIWCITNRTPARRVTPPWTFTWQNLTPAERATRSGRPGYPPWRAPHLSCKRDQIKMRDYMDRRATSPPWGPPPPCKQALIHYVLTSLTHLRVLIRYETREITCEWQWQWKCFVLNKILCRPNIISIVANNETELWKPVRWTSFQKPQLQSVSIFFKVVQSSIPLCDLLYHLLFLLTFLSDYFNVSLDLVQVATVWILINFVTQSL